MLAGLLALVLCASPEGEAAPVEGVEQPSAESAEELPDIDGAEQPDAGASEARAQPEPVEPPDRVEPSAAVEPPAPQLPSEEQATRASVSVVQREGVLRRCLAGTSPCYRSGGARLLLAGVGLVTIGASLYALFGGSDRQGLGDPWPALAGAGTIAMGASTIGGIAGLVGLDGPAIPDRITPATVGLGVGLGGTGVTDERAPYSMAASLAPTLAFPHDLGRVRLLANFGGSLGASLERDPRPQSTAADGTFNPALSRQGWRFEGGVDLAVRLPYPLGSRSPKLGRFELRYKPLFFYAREHLYFASDFPDGDEEGTPTGEATISERTALTPLNFGLRWNLSPRERFTVYFGPRWDVVRHGPAGALARSAPQLAPIYAEAWFDIDLRLQRARANRRASVVGQFTVGYVHSRFDGLGLNFGAVVGFLGPVVSQFALRVRPRGSLVAYQLELGARAGGGLHPYLRVGIVLPDLSPGRRRSKGESP